MLLLLDRKLIVKVNSFDLLGHHFNLCQISTLAANRKHFLDLKRFTRSLFLKRVYHEIVFSAFNVLIELVILGGIHNVFACYR